MVWRMARLVRRLFLAPLWMGPWPRPVLGRHRRRRQSLQTEDFHHRIHDQKRYRIYVKINRGQELVYDKVQDRSIDTHQHRDKVLRDLQRFEIIVALLCQQGLQTSRRPGSQVSILSERTFERRHNFFQPVKGLRKHLYL